MRVGDELLYDEPGRCGGLDCHSHHYRVVKQYGQRWLLVRHGGGDDSIKLHLPTAVEGLLANLDSNARYWLLHTIYYVHWESTQNATDNSDQKWRLAAAEKRIKTRKNRKSQSIRVWIEPPRDTTEKIDTD
jgi:hypothetical protein